MKMKLREAKILPKEHKKIFLELLRVELGEQIANHADFMRKHLDWRRRDKLPKEERGYQGPLSLLLLERFNEVDRHKAYFRWTKPYEIVVCDKQ